MSISRYDMEAKEIFFVENGFPQSDGYEIYDIPSDEGTWVLHDDYEKLRKEFENYHYLVLQLLDYVMDEKVPPVELFNKCATTHNKTCHIRKMLGLPNHV